MFLQKDEFAVDIYIEYRNATFRYHLIRDSFTKFSTSIFSFFLSPDSHPKIILKETVNSPLHGAVDIAEFELSDVNSIYNSNFVKKLYRTKE